MPLGGDIAQALGKFLYSHGLILRSFREVLHETRVNFSFADETPGVKNDEICVYAQAERIDKATKTEYEKIQFKTLSELMNLADILHGPATALEGVYILNLERTNLGA